MNSAKINLDTAWVLESFLLKGKDPKIHSDREDYLKACNEYVVLAKAMPYQEMCETLKEYDNSNPKMDELKLLKTLMEKYDQTKENVLLRIKYVRKLSKLNLAENNN